MTIEFTPEHIGAHDKVLPQDEQAIMATAEKLSKITGMSITDSLKELGYEVVNDTQELDPQLVAQLLKQLGVAK